MKVKLGTGEVVDVEHISSFEEMVPSKRLFYELGYWQDFHHTKWKSTGVFKEIKDVDGFRKHHTEEMPDNYKHRERKYINHHNFVIEK